MDKLLHRSGYYHNGQRIALGNHLAMSDKSGELQIVEKSIIAGGYKYSKTLKPKVGEEKLQLFDKVLSETDELQIIGYGFNDRHINIRLYNAKHLRTS
jgi:hypothetical protein